MFSPVTFPLVMWHQGLHPGYRITRGRPVSLSASWLRQFLRYSLLLTTLTIWTSTPIFHRVVPQLGFECHLKAQAQP